MNIQAQIQQKIAEKQAKMLAAVRSSNLLVVERYINDLFVNTPKFAMHSLEQMYFTACEHAGKEVQDYVMQRLVACSGEASNEALAYAAISNNMAVMQHATEHASDQGRYTALELSIENNFLKGTQYLLERVSVDTNNTHILYAAIGSTSEIFDLIYSLYSQEKSQELLRELKNDDRYFEPWWGQLEDRVVRDKLNTTLTTVMDVSTAKARKI